MRITTSLPILFVLISTPLSSRADEGCDSWFCAEPKSDDSPKVGPETASKLKGSDVGVVLKDGSIVRGVIVEIAPDHLTLAAGASTITVAWGEVVSIGVDPTTPAEPPKKAEAPADASEPKAKNQEPVVEDTPNAAPEAPCAPAAPIDHDELSEPGPRPAFAPGLFAIGVRAKIVAPLEGQPFFTGSEMISDYVSGGLGYELSFGVRLTGSLMLRGGWEHAELFRGEKNVSVASSPTSDVVGIGVRWLFGDAPEIRGIFEAGVGYRWLRVPYSSGAAPDGSPRTNVGGIATFAGAESVRTAIGAAFPTDEHGRIEMLLEASFGHFSHIHDETGALRSRTFSDSTDATHAFLGISVGLELGP